MSAEVAHGGLSDCKIDVLGDSKEVQIRELTPAMEDAWDHYAHAHPRGRLYHLTAWRNLVTGIFGHSTCYLYATQGENTIAGLLPMVRLRSWLFGDFMVSMPYVNYGGAIGDNEAMEQALMTRASEIADGLGVGHIEFRDSVPGDPSWKCRTDKVIMECSLPDSVEQLWKGLGSKLRAQVKRPKKEGATVAIGGKELIAEFYRVFARNMRDLGTPVYARVFFDAIMDAFADNTRIVVVRLRNNPVAAGLLLADGDRIEIPWASSLREYNRYGVNMLLYWSAMEHAIEEGRGVFDFGRSSRDAGTYRFKAQWGATPRQLYWHYWLESGRQLPGLSPDNPKYRLAIRAWRLLPVPVANRLGPAIVRNLP